MIKSLFSHCLQISGIQKQEHKFSNEIFQKILNEKSFLCIFCNIKLKKIFFTLLFLYFRTYLWRACAHGVTPCLTLPFNLAELILLFTLKSIKDQETSTEWTSLVSTFFSKRLLLQNNVGNKTNHFEKKIFLIGIVMRWGGSN